MLRPKQKTEPERTDTGTRSSDPLPEISPADRAEQLLLEYQSAPNPESMLYFYEADAASWQCPCGARHSNDFAFCGRCGVARSWLEEHTDERYLAERIAERKGPVAVRWHRTKALAGKPQEETKIRPVSSPETIVPERLRVDTRLDGYEGNRLNKLIQYMGRYGNPRRRLILVMTGVVVLLLLAVAISKLPGL